MASGDSGPTTSTLGPDASAHPALATTPQRYSPLAQPPPLSSRLTPEGAHARSWDHCWVGPTVDNTSQRWAAQAPPPPGRGRGFPAAPGGLWDQSSRCRSALRFCSASSPLGKKRVGPQAPNSALEDALASTPAAPLTPTAAHPHWETGTGTLNRPAGRHFGGSTAPAFTSHRWGGACPGRGPFPPAQGPAPKLIFWGRGLTVTVHPILSRVQDSQELRNISTPQWRRGSA